MNLITQEWLDELGWENFSFKSSINDGLLCTTMIYPGEVECSITTVDLGEPCLQVEFCGCELEIIKEKWQLEMLFKALKQPLKYVQI